LVTAGNRYKSEIMLTRLGGASQNCLQKFINFFVTLGLKSWDYLGLKYSLKQILLKGDVNYWTKYKVSIYLSITTQ